MLEVGKEYWIYATESNYVDYKAEWHERTSKDRFICCSFLKKIKILKINIRSYTVEMDGKKENIKFGSYYEHLEDGRLGNLIYNGDKLEHYKIIESEEELKKLSLEYENYNKIVEFKKVHENNSRIEHYKNEIEKNKKQIEELEIMNRNYEAWIRSRESKNEIIQTKVDEGLKFLKTNCKIDRN